MALAYLHKLYTTFSAPTSGRRMPFWLTITTILLAVALLVWDYLLFDRATIQMDGFSYFQAWDRMKTLHTDVLRTPVYATFIGVLNELFGRNGALFIIPILQWIAYIGALQLLWQINFKLKIHKAANIAIIFAMFLFPGFWVFNNFTMAESLSTSAIILLIWLTIRYTEDKRKTHLIQAWLLVIILTMTKPMFILLIPVLVVFCIIVCWKNKVHLKISAWLLTLSCSVLGAYTYCMKHTYTMPVLTLASVWNEYVGFRYENLLRPEDIDDPELRAIFEPYYQAYPCGLHAKEYWQEMQWGMNYTELYTLANLPWEKHPQETRMAILKRFPVEANTSHFHSLYNTFNIDPTISPQFIGWNGMTKNDKDGYIMPLHAYLWYPIWVGWAITLAFSAVWITRWIRRRKFPPLAYFIAATMVTAYITVTIGAQDDWGRILTPFNPLVPIMAGSLISIFAHRIKLLYERRK